MSIRVAHGEEASPGMPDDIEGLEAKFVAKGFEIDDLRFHTDRSGGVEEFGFTYAALVVKDDLALLGEASGKDIAEEHVVMGKARPSVEDDGRSCRGGRAIDFIGEIHIVSVNDSGFRCGLSENR